MFSFITDSIENALDVAADTVDMMVGGEPPERKQVAKLLADGLTVYGIAEIYGVAESVIEELVEW